MDELVDASIARDLIEGGYTLDVYRRIDHPFADLHPTENKKVGLLSNGIVTSPHYADGKLWVL